MQKYLMILLLVLSSFDVCAMDEDNLSSFFRSLRSYAWPTNKNLSPMQELQIKKSRFEAQLRSSGDQLGVVLRFDMQTKPIVFLRYCYRFFNHDRTNDYYHDEIAIDVDGVGARNPRCWISDLDGLLLNKCKEAQIDGYSILGTAIIAKTPTIESKRNYIQKLIKKGFVLTEKDKELVALKLYEAIPADQKETMIFLLQNHQKDNFVLLPHEVRRCIVDYIVRLYQEKEWLYSLL